NPNVNHEGQGDSKKRWPLFTISEQKHVVLNTESLKVHRGMRNQMCAFWDRFLPRLLNITVWQEGYDEDNLSLPIMHWEALSLRIAELEKQEELKKEQKAMTPACSDPVVQRRHLERRELQNFNIEGLNAVCTSLSQSIQGFFVPFSIIAWCYSHVVLTIFRTLHSQPSSYKISKEKRCEQSNRRERRGNNNHLVPLQREEGISIFLGARSPYASRRRKSIKTIITITLLFALCFFPFHVTRTVFLLLKVAKGVPCHTMTAVSMCYKITRPLASFNAWLNALLYFLTKDKGGTQCCQPANANVQHHHGHFSF
ncbi:unnamed protein product, partial [Tetraodon nigroviridis]